MLKRIVQFFAIVLVAVLVVSCNSDKRYRSLRMSKKVRTKVHGHKIEPGKATLLAEKEKAEQREADKARIQHNLKVANSRNKSKYQVEKKHNEPFSHH